MSSFTTDLDIRLLDYAAYLLDVEKNEALPEDLYDGEHWQLNEEFDYEIGVKGSGKTIHVPKGYITDFASVPKIFWNIFPPTGKYGKAAVIHDYLYSHNGIFSYKDKDGIWQTEILNRQECDAEFAVAMIALRVGWLTRRLMYRGVRVGGGWTWKNYLKKQKRVVLDGVHSI